jgi:uncharacterized Zn-binding protein involved in type VI secretion
MPGLAAIITGTCTGHGVPIKAHIHSVNPCNAFPACPPGPTPVKPVAVKNATCLWPPTKLTPLRPDSIARTVFINGVTPLCDGDQLIFHISPTTNIVIVPAGSKCKPKKIPCICSRLAAEDLLGRGHDRIVKATTSSVFVNGRRLATVGDFLGPPCLSVIGTGSANVIVGR